jgi:16S rRNA (cytidine1402-2'-O)-methyltransferase
MSAGRPDKPAARLILVSTPIGNLADMALRGLEVLKRVEAILAEDTRHTRKLLAHYGIRKRLIAYHDHNKERVTPAIIERLERGEEFALVSDAGTPGISDPGFYIVREAIAHNIPISIVPGANAVLPAVVLSGFPTDAFCFEGFFPRKKKEKERLLAALREETRTTVFFVSPHKLLRVLAEFDAVLPERMLAVVRELTKIHEEVIRGLPGELLEIFGGRRVRGEIVLVVHGAPRRRNDSGTKPLDGSKSPMVED